MKKIILFLFIFVFTCNALFAMSEENAKTGITQHKPASRPHKHPHKRPPHPHKHHPHPHHP